MGLDLSTWFVLWLIGRQGRGPAPPDLAALRRAADRQVLPRWIPRLGVAGVADSELPGPAGALRIRIYRPRGRPRGVVLFLHGGGFVHCGLESHDGICCRLTRRSGCVVVALDYRLAPEHRFPAAVQDCYAALCWVAAQAEALAGPGARLAVAGDSAGGNLAAVVAQLARDRGGPALAFQLLYYPPTHGLRDVPSRHEFAEGYFLTGAIMRWYLSQYIGEAQHMESPCFAPFLAEDLRGLPPAMIITAEYDPLRDEGAEYAARLREAGVAVEYVCHRGTIHAFLNFYPMLRKGRRAIDQGGRAIRRAVGRD
jgi:acetyl esterase